MKYGMGYFKKDSNLFFLFSIDFRKKHIPHGI
jgi:hypothetical protein